MREFLFGLLCSISFPVFAGGFDYEELKFAAVKEYITSAKEYGRTGKSGPWTESTAFRNFLSNCSLVVVIGSHHNDVGISRPNEVNLGGGPRCDLNDFAYVEGIYVPRNSMRGVTATLGIGFHGVVWEEGQWKVLLGITFQAGIYENTRTRKTGPVIFGGPTLEACRDDICGWGLLIPERKGVLILGTSLKFDKIERLIEE